MRSGDDRMSKRPSAPTWGGRSPSGPWRPTSRSRRWSVPTTSSPKAGASSGRTSARPARSPDPLASARIGRQDGRGRDWQTSDDTTRRDRIIGMANLQRMAQQMQQEMLRVQTELDAATVDGSAGGGVVSATVTGKQELVSLTIDPSAVDPEDVEMLQDLVIAAVNE